MKKYKKIILWCLIASILLSLILTVYNLSNKKIYINNNLDIECKYVAFFNRHNKNGSNQKCLVYYYDENAELIHIEDFKPKDKVPNQILINNKIYSYGYGGVYQTDYITKKTTPINTETPINIVKYDNYGNVYTYQNFGYEKGSEGKYISKILKNNELYIQLDYPVQDFCALNDKLYVTTYNDIYFKKGKIFIYENKEKIKEFEIDFTNVEGNWAIYNDEVFFLRKESAIKFENDKMEEISLEGDNKKITNETNYNISKDKYANCHFDKEKQIFTLNDKIITINDNGKYSYVFLGAFEM